MYFMRKNFKITLFALAIVLVVASAFTLKPTESTQKAFVGELYWFAPGSQSYTGSFRTVNDEISQLSAADPSHTYNTIPTGGTLVEEGFDNSQLNVSGQPSQGHKTVEPMSRIYRH